MELNLVTVNVNGSVRRDKIGNREYLVAPLSMIVPGVLNGNNGPKLYTDDEVGKNPQSWNGMPIVVNHPQVDGTFVSARQPTIMDKYAVGAVYNTNFNGKLSAEGWFDIERTNEVEPRIVQALERGEAMELSTGVFSKDQPVTTNNTHDGKSYVAIVRDLEPDHLAILPDQKGACSLKDGCGLNVNQTEQGTEQVAQPFNFERALSQLLKGEITANVLSHSDVSAKLDQFVRANYANNLPENERWGVYVVDVYDNYFIYRGADGELYKQSYSYKAKSNELTVDASEPTKVQKVTIYEPVTTPVMKETLTGNSTSEGDDMEKLTQEQRQAAIAQLTTNCACQAEDKAHLEKLSDSVLSSLVTNKNKEQAPNIPAPQAAAPVQAPAQVQLPEGVMQTINALSSPEFQSMVALLTQQGGQVKEKLIKHITANSKSLTEDQLKNMDVNTLQGIASTITAAQQSVQPQSFNDFSLGAGVQGFSSPSTMNTNAGVPEPLGDTPRIDFAKEAGIKV